MGDWWRDPSRGSGPPLRRLFVTRWVDLRGDYARWLRETAGSLEAQVRDRLTLAALASLGRAGFILATTNYDGLLSAETGYRAVTWQERGQVERALRGDERGVLHLHGRRRVQVHAEGGEGHRRRRGR